MAGLVRVKAAGPGDGDREALHADQFGEGVEGARHPLSAGLLTCSASPSGAAPSIQVAVPWVVMLMGPCRYSIAG